MTETCSICGSPATNRRGDRILCASCYAANVPSWQRGDTDRIGTPAIAVVEDAQFATFPRRDGLHEYFTDEAPGSLAIAPFTRRWQQLRVLRDFALTVLVTVMFSVVTVRAALSSEWGDVVIAVPIAVVNALFSLRFWRRMKAPNKASEESA